jgi:hypothetical protein
LIYSGFMRCKCGFNFSVVERSFESYAVARDSDYAAFLKSERRIQTAKTQSAKLRAIARSSELVGSLLECPQCSRILLLKPGGEQALFLRREE